MFFLSQDEALEVGDVFHQTGPKLFVIRDQKALSSKNQKQNDLGSFTTKKWKAGQFPRRSNHGTFSNNMESQNEKEQREIKKQASQRYDLGRLPTFILQEDVFLPEYDTDVFDSENTLDPDLVHLLSSFEEKNTEDEEENLEEQFFQDLEDSFFNEETEEIENIN